MTSSTIACAVAFGCLVVIYVGKRYLGKTKPTFPLPPGPPGLPWVGNVIGIDANAPWLTYRDWAKTYGKSPHAETILSTYKVTCAGDIVHSRLLGKDIIIINSEKIARDLLDNRSSNNSDRPHMITNELCGIDFNTALLPYGDRWRLQRRFFHQTLRPDAIERFLPFQHRKACQLLRQLFNTPLQFDQHVFQYTATIVLNSAYDYDPPPHDDELIKIAAKVQEIAISVVRPDIAIIVATFPMLLKLPAWFPGMSFKTEMAMAKDLTRQYVETAFEYSLQRVREYRTAPSMVHDALRNMEEKGTAPDQSWIGVLKEASATAFLASETSHSSLMTFFLMMALNPEVQAKAQTQIDAVVGNDRLPTVADRPMLPFIDAILRETLRYSPVAPLSIPYSAGNDDVYDGFHIPKGAILITNLWAMAHDESRYPNPHTFIPERFLNEDGSLNPDDVEHIAYGFGRRICAGRHFANSFVWTLIARVLAVFKILKPLDENGVEISLEPKFSSGLATRPLPFQCRIVPRMPGMDAEKLEELIAASTA
ncbi:cytochrome P450 [Imleria badia]|nr:cytochrome P450 [Imleria badia]